MRMVKLYNFRSWLLQKGMSAKHTKDLLSRISFFLEWLSKEKSTIESLNYNRLLDYIEYLEQQDRSKRSINTSLLSIDHYYQYLQCQDRTFRIANIARKIRIKGISKKVPLLLSATELDALYTDYRDPTARSYFKYTNKLILGLIIYQGLEVSEIGALELIHLELDKGLLYVPSGLRLKNARTVALEAHQVIPLQEYIKTHRAKPYHIRHRTTIKNSTKLFSPNCDLPNRFEGQLKILRKTLRTQTSDIKVRNLKQLRQSRIAIWIKQYGLRKAQYLSGYKNIQNVERYQELDLQELAKQIEKFHPLQ